MEKNFNKEEEKVFLNKLVPDYKDKSPYSEIKKDIILGKISNYLVEPGKKKGLQLGCASGYETRFLAGKMKTLTVVDGSSVFIEKLQEESAYDNVEFVYSLFEEFTFDEHGEKYDYIFCNYILEHVFDPVQILANLKGLLKPGGLLFIVVPNCDALSRRIAQKMGMINNLRDLTENDHKHGHRRVYDQTSITSDVTKAGFATADVKGIVLKILADFQLNDLLHKSFLADKHIIALQELADEKENIAFSDSIFVVASLLSDNL